MLQGHVRRVLSSSSSRSWLVGGARIVWTRGSITLRDEDGAVILRDELMLENEADALRFVAGASEAALLSINDAMQRSERDALFMALIRAANGHALHGRASCREAFVGQRRLIDVSRRRRAAGRHGPQTMVEDGVEDPMTPPGYEIWHRIWLAVGPVGRHPDSDAILYPRERRLMKAALMEIIDEGGLEEAAELVMAIAQEPLDLRNAFSPRDKVRVSVLRECVRSIVTHEDALAASGL